MQTQRILSLSALAFFCGFSQSRAAVQVLEQGRDYERVRWIKQAVDATGRTVLKTNEYTEVGSGLNHLDETGRWVRSQPRFNSHSGGIVGTGAGHRVILSPNINVQGSVDLELPDGKRLVSHPLCLRYYDPDTGQTLIIATLTDSAAQLLSSNEVIYPSALMGEGVQAGVVYRYRPGSFHQDVVFESAVPAPPVGFGPRTRLEMITELVALPVHSIRSRVLRYQHDPDLRQAAVEPDFLDSTLDFGQMLMGPGRAFGTADAAFQVRAPVGKSVQSIDGRTLLIEAVEWHDVREQLQRLPRKSASTGGEDEAKMAGRTLPPPPVAKRVETGSPVVLLAHAPLGEAFILDYEIVSGTGSFTFETGETYLVNGSIFSHYTVDFRAGAIIKLPSLGMIFMTGAIICPYWYDWEEWGDAIFTSKDDNTVGAEIIGSTGNPSGYYGYPFEVEGLEGSPVFEYLDFRYSREAMDFDLMSETSITIQYCKFSHCDVGVIAREVEAVLLRYSQMCGVDPCFQEEEAGTVTTLLVTTCPDSDGDGLLDSWELEHFGDLDETATGDPDADGLSNIQEYQLGTDPDDADSDNDGMPDGWEWSNFKTFGRNGAGDFDGDGVTDAAEFTAGTSPISRGNVILVVDESLLTDSEVSDRIDRLVLDLIGDSWWVLRHNIGRGVDTPQPTDYPNIPKQWTPAQWAQVRSWSEANGVRVREVRSLIKADYDASPGEGKAVFLIGHVPVPYSADTPTIGGSESDMWGAHPADLFYGDMVSPYGAGGWSDTLVDNNHALADGTRDTRGPWPKLPGLMNEPGDGKFDQGFPPSPLRLAVGRLDLYQMPEFGVSEAVLISSYLDRNHDFRRGSISVNRRAVVRSWNSGPLFMPNIAGLQAVFGVGQAYVNVESLTHMHWFPDVSGQGEDFLVGYGGGNGGPASAYGVGTTGPDPALIAGDLCPVDCLGFDAGQNKCVHNFVEQDSRVVFLNLMGSYFGSWDQANNFLRAPLANPYDPTGGRHGYGLTTFWGMSGLDQAILTKEALGACIGEALFSGKTIHSHYALMGDPTLRMHSVPPPSALGITISGGTAQLTWMPSGGGVSGYHIYRAPTEAGPFTLVNPGSAPVAAAPYDATRPPTSDPPDNFYMIRAVKIETTLAGSYVNMSEGIVEAVPGSPTPYLDIIRQPCNQAVTIAGSSTSVAFAVDAVGVESGGSTTLAYQWFNGSTPLSDDSHFSGTQTRALLIRGVQSSDAGSYHVLVSNGAGSVTSVAAVLTTTPP